MEDIVILIFMVYSIWYKIFYFIVLVYRNKYKGIFLDLILLLY